MGGKRQRGGITSFLSPSPCTTSWTLRSPGPCVSSRVNFNVGLNDTRGSSVWNFSSLALSLSTADIWRETSSLSVKLSDSEEEGSAFPRFIIQERKALRDIILSSWADIMCPCVFSFQGLGLERMRVSSSVIWV